MNFGTGCVGRLREPAQEDHGLGPLDPRSYRFQVTFSRLTTTCYLNVERFFGSLHYRRYLYYGRVLRRGIGGVDRIWHQSKAANDPGRRTLDKSPEPSEYADGSGGVCPRAHGDDQPSKAERAQGASAWGCEFDDGRQVGRRSSGTTGIGPSNENYGPISADAPSKRQFPWECGKIRSSREADKPTQVVHLDNKDDQLRTHQRKRDVEL